MSDRQMPRRSARLQGNQEQEESTGNLPSSLLWAEVVANSASEETGNQGADSSSAGTRRSAQDSLAEVSVACSGGNDSS